MHSIHNIVNKEYKILLTCPFLKQNAVKVVVNEKFASKATQRADLLEIIDNQWNKITKEKPFLFNQSKFRYHDGHMSENGEPQCYMNFGLTDYKSYIGSNLGYEWKRFYDEGVKIGDTDAFFGNPLGNQCVVVLNDGYHIILNRSYQVAEGQGQLTCVGGHPEPSSINLNSYKDIKTVTSDMIVNELFDSMKREVHEETNIPHDLVQDMKMIGIIACATSHGRQVQMFCCFVDLNRDQVRRLYCQGPEDQYETLGIKFMTLDEIVNKMNNEPHLFVPETRGVYSCLLENEALYNKEVQKFVTHI